MEVLTGYLYLDQAAKQIRKSKRTVQRMIERGEIPVTHLGKTPVISVASWRQALDKREVKPVDMRRRRCR